MTKPLAPISPTEDDFMEALRAFLVSILPAGVVVLQGQANRIAEPGVEDYVVMTPAKRNRLATNVELVVSAGGVPIGVSSSVSTQFSAQLDIHGPMGSDNAQTISNLSRSSWGVDQFPPGIVPLWAEDGRQTPFVNGENQYENRWTTEIYLQGHPIISTPQDFADTLRVVLTPIGG